MPANYPLQANRGRLFKNDQTRNPRAPGYTGSCVVDGKLYRIAAWINEPDDRNPRPTIALQFESQEDADARRQVATEAEQAREAPNQSPPRQATLIGEPDDDIPF
jgi:hypothetical protein